MFVNCLVVKVASRCNINCKYCYMYNHADQSYKLQPKFISKDIILKLKEKIKNHCIKHTLKKFYIVLHGGEPLLMSIIDLRFFLNTINSLHDEIGVKIVFGVQTNGILLNKEYCDLLNEYNVGIGISLDGNESTNDQNRVDKKGKGTYQSVKKGIIELENNRITNFGALSVVNIDSNPIETYETFKEVGFKACNFLLIDENYDTLESQNDILTEHKTSKWLIELFDYWYNQENSTRIQIPKFEDFINFILGADGGTESYGIGNNTLAVIETNGDIEPLDVLKICGEEFTKHKFNISINEIDDVFQSNLVETYYYTKTYLPKKCLACPVKEICGGGYLPHRYSSKNGFNNPSIYCNDHLKLITHIQNRIIDDLPSEITQKLGVQKISYEDALKIINENISKIEEPEYVELLESFKK